MTEAGLRAAFLRRKPIDDIESEGGGLERTLGLWQLTAIGVGGIIGAGIFSLAGAVANETRRAGRADLVPHRRASPAPRPRSPTRSSPG